MITTGIRVQLRLVLALLLAFSATPASGAATPPDDFPAHLEVREGWYPHLVNIDFVKRYAVVPPRPDVVIIDTRDLEKRYATGHIPGAISIPARRFDELAPDLLPADKGRLLLLYCDGVDCKLSHLAALDAEDLGYTNIRVYVEGFPDWFKRGNVYAVAAAYLQKSLAAGHPLTLVDVRAATGGDEPQRIPGAIRLPPERFSALAGSRLPADKSRPLVFYCDQPQQIVSYEAAARAKALGYRDVAVLAGGYTAWNALVKTPSARRTEPDPLTTWYGPEKSAEW